MRSIGLTGGIACGKSLATDTLRSLGVWVVDADEIVHDLFERPVVRKEIRNHFQTTDKKELREIIFRKPQARKVLENILHPRVRKKIRTALSKAKKYGAPLAVVSIPLLFETQMEEMFDQVIVVTCKDGKQISRLTKRDGIDEEHAHRMMTAQMPLSVKEALADVVWTNNGSKAAFEKKVQRWFEKTKTWT